MHREATAAVVALLVEDWNNIEARRGRDGAAQLAWVLAVAEAWPWTAGHKHGRLAGLEPMLVMGKEQASR